MAGLKRDEMVFLSRMQHDYVADKLPNDEQIRFDNGRLVAIVLRLQQEIDKMLREERA